MSNVALHPRSRKKKEGEREREGKRRQKEKWMRKQRYAIISIRPVYPVAKWVISICSRDSGSIRNIRCRYKSEFSLIRLH